MKLKRNLSAGYFVALSGTCFCRVIGTNAWYFPVPITDSPVIAKESFSRITGLKDPGGDPVRSAIELAEV